MNHIKYSVITGILALALSSFAEAGIVVVANPSVADNSLTAAQVSQLFMGRAKALPDGTAVTPLDLPEGSALRVQFADRVLGKTEQQLRSYWTRIIFTGKGQPPRSLGSAAEVLRTVAANPGHIGYVDSKDVVGGKVKVLFTLE